MSNLAVKKSQDKHPMQSQKYIPEDKSDGIHSPNLSSIVEQIDACYKIRRKSKQNTSEEKEKGDAIMSTDTIINPGTMMVKLFDTSIASLAMFRA